MNRPAAAAPRGPRLRRPAAAAAKVEPRRRLRRPPAVGETVEEKFNRGEEVACEDIQLHWLKPGDWIQVAKGVYGGEEATLAGKVQRVLVEGEQRELEAILTGTRLESLLRYASGHTPALVRIHLCSPSCDQLRVNPDLIHTRALQRLEAASPKTWEENLLGVDELQPLRAHHDSWRAKQPPGEEESKSSGSKEKTKKKKKEDDKKSDGKSGKKKKKKKKKVGGRLIAKKKLEDVFSGTGLDPDQKQRRILLHKTKKRLRKTKSSSSSSGSSSSSSSSLLEAQDLLDDKSKIQRLAILAPGLLAMQGVTKMKENINQAGGTPWGLDDSSIPPISLQYTRQFLLPRASQAMSRELLTLSHVLDYLLQGRCAEAADAACQRLKALEMVQQGQNWATAAKVEVVSGMEPTVASRPEVQIAAKEAQLDAKAKGSSWSSEGKGKAKGSGKSKGKDKDKGKAGGRGDQKKGQSS